MDGAPVKIPDKLLSPPEDLANPFILDILAEDAKIIVQGWKDNTTVSTLTSLDPPKSLSEPDLLDLLASESLALPEYARVQMMFSYCRRTQSSPTPYLAAIDWQALTSIERHTVEEYLMPFYDPGPILWNR